MANEVKIRAKKISELQNLDISNIRVNDDNNNSVYNNLLYLLGAAVEDVQNQQPASNFKISLADLITEITNDSKINNTELANKLLSILNNTLEGVDQELYETILNKIKYIGSSDSVLNWAKNNHGFMGNDNDLWDLILGANTNANQNFNPSDINSTDSNSYIFSYFSSSTQNIFQTINGVQTLNFNTIIDLSYTQKNINHFPNNNLQSNNGFYFVNYLAEYKPSFTWHSSVAEGNIYILIPQKYFDNETNLFKDDYGRKWQLISPIGYDIKPVSKSYPINNNINYCLLCISENGMVGDAYFKIVI